MSPEPPPEAVLAAFGAAGLATPLAGGSRPAWRVGDLVLKPLDLHEDELWWQASVLAGLGGRGFRAAPPIATEDGELVCAGWTAWRHVTGAHAAGRWLDIIAAGNAFHAALAEVPRPAFIDRRTHPWAVADRVAWGEVDPAALPPVKHLAQLQAAVRPLTARAQIVHGDLTGNVLFAPGLPPAIIDFSAYWRPPAFASAVVVADALVFEGAGPDLVTAAGGLDDRFDQYLLRALIYRVVTDRLFRLHEPIRSDAEDPYLAAVELACIQAAG